MKCRLLIVMLLLLLAAPVMEARAAGWETVERTASVERVDNDPASDVVVRDGYLYVTVGRRVTVKVFTILGQLISQETLQPGTHRLKIASRGIYILRIGSTTRRVTI